MPSVASSIGTTDYALRGDNELVVTRTFDAPRRIVFDAYTSPKHIPNWMLGPDGWTMPVCEVDLRPGGAWHFVWRKASGEEMGMTGTYREVTPPTRVVNTETWGPEWPETVNTIDFTESGGITTMTLTVSYPSKEAREMALKTGMKDGMERSYARLDGLIASLV